MIKLFDRVKVNIPTTGTGDIEFGAAASTAFLTPTEAGVLDGDEVRYVIVDGLDFEEGVGLIKDTVATMERTVTKSKIGGAVGTSALNLSGTAVLALSASAADILTPDDNLASLDNADTALDNLGGTTVGKAVFAAVDADAARAAIVADTLPGHLWGLTLSNNATDAINDIDISVGSCADSTGLHRMALASALTKSLDAAWAVGSGNGGLDTGSVADSTYHVFLIQRSDTGIVDALFSTSATSPTMPSSYDRKRRIGSIIRKSGAILAFSQEGDEFLLKSSVADVYSTSQSTTAVLYALSVPGGIKTHAIISSTSIGPTGSGTNYSVYISSPDQNDEASATPSTAGAHTYGVGNLDVKTMALGWIRIRTDTASRVRARASGACSNFRIQTYGWIDTRGRLA